MIIIIIIIYATTAWERSAAKPYDDSINEQERIYYDLSGYVLQVDNDKSNLCF